MIAIGCDHAAVELKNKIKAHLENQGYKVTDYGCFTDQAVDYADYAYKVATAVTSGVCDRGVLICGTGIGMSIAANKVKGVRCALCGDTFSAKATREHNDANILALGQRVIGEGLALEIVDTFMHTGFSGESRHVRRIEKIAKLEELRK